MNQMLPTINWIFWTRCYLQSIEYFGPDAKSCMPSALINVDTKYLTKFINFKMTILCCKRMVKINRINLYLLRTDASRRQTRNCSFPRFLDKGYYILRYHLLIVSYLVIERDMIAVLVWDNWQVHRRKTYNFTHKTNRH